MADYRFYRFEGGHIKVAVTLDCADDAEASAQAEDVFDGAAIELWQGTRLVKRIEPDQA